MCGAVVAESRPQLILRALTVIYLCLITFISRVDQCCSFQNKIFSNVAFHQEMLVFFYVFVLLSFVLSPRTFSVLVCSSRSQSVLLPALHPGGRFRHQPGHGGHRHHLRLGLEPSQRHTGAVEQIFRGGNYLLSKLA